MPGGKGNITGEDGIRFTTTRQPKNRRVSLKPLTDLLRNESQKKQIIIIEGLDTITGQKHKIKVLMPSKKVIIQSFLRQCAKGNMLAIKEYFDRIEGRTVQSVAMTDKDGDDIVTPLTDSQVNNILNTLRENKPT